MLMLLWCSVEYRLRQTLNVVFWVEKLGVGRKVCLKNKHYLTFFTYKLFLLAQITFLNTCPLSLSDSPKFSKEKEKNYIKII